MGSRVVVVHAAPFGRAGPGDRLDLVVADRRRVVEGLPADVLVLGVTALSVVVVDEVSGVDRRSVLPDRLRVDRVDDGLGARARLCRALHELRVENGLQLRVDDEGLRPHHVEDLLENELAGRRRVHVEAGEVLVESEGQVATAAALTAVVFVGFLLLWVVVVPPPLLLLLQAANTSAPAPISAPIVTPLLILLTRWTSSVPRPQMGWPSNRKGYANVTVC